MYKLSPWDITKSFWEKEHYRACGNVYGNPKFKEGRDITTSEIIDCEFDQDKNLIIQTENSYYFLPKESFNGIDYSLVEEMTEVFFSLKEKLMKAAKKLLSVGDCIICYDRIIYHSRDGLISLETEKCQGWRKFYIASYEKENLKIKWDADTINSNVNIKSLEHENSDGFVYSILFGNKDIKKRSFKTVVKQDSDYDESDFDDDDFDDLFDDF